MPKSGYNSRSENKMMSVKLNFNNVGLGTILAFIVGVAIPLALVAYVFYCQIVSLEVLSELKDSRLYEDKKHQDQLTQIFASNIIVIILYGSALLAGVYGLGAGLVAMTN